MSYNYNYYYPPREDTSKDEEIAKMLQRLENLEISQHNLPPVGGSLINYPPINPVNPVNPIPINPINPVNPHNPLPNSVLSSSLVLPIEEDKCIICKQPFTVSFYTFPQCAPRSNHNYCEVCARRLITLNENKVYGAQPSFHVTCKYCHSKSELQSIAALENFRKPYQPKSNAQKEGLFRDGNCPYHDKMLIYFCHTCYEPICASCSSGFHKTHRLDDLDTAYQKVQQQFLSAKASLEFKRGKVNQNMQTLLDTRDSLSKQADTCRAKVNNEIDQLITLLQNKKHALNQRINDLEESKKTEIDNQIQNTTRVAEDIEQSISFVVQQSQNLNYSQNPLEFFQVVGAKGKDFVNDLNNKAVPFVAPSFHFGDISTHQARKDINNIKLPF